MVYVDPAVWPWRGKMWCHLVADSHDELIRFAITKMRLKRRWIQDEGTYREHFDLTSSVRDRAIKLGAIPITTKQLGKILLVRLKEQQNVQTTQKPSESRPSSKETVSQVSKP